MLAAPPAAGRRRRSQAPLAFECHESCSCGCAAAAPPRSPSCVYRPSAARAGRPLAVIACGRKGWGLACGETLEQGAPVCTYGGDLVRTATAMTAGTGLLTRSKGPAMNFVLTVVEVFGGGGADGNLTLATTVDASRRGSAGRFVNHSCGPNLELVSI